MDNNDRRSSPRVSVDRLVIGLGKTERWVVAGNLSIGGVGFWVNQPIQIGDGISIELTVSEQTEPLHLQGVVCHLRPASSNAALGWYVGARFVGLDVLEQWPLDRYVEEEATKATIRSKPRATM